MNTFRASEVPASLLRGQGRVVGGGRWWLGLGLAGALLPAAAQDYFTTVNPFSLPRDPALDGSEPIDPTGLQYDVFTSVRSGGMSDYNIKLGPVFMWFRAGLIFRYQSNYNLVDSDNSTGTESDFTIGPALSVSMRYDISETASLAVSTGLSYQWSLNSNQNRLILAPASNLDYQFGVGPVRISLFDRVATTSTATFDPTISGTGSSSLMDFNRISNTVGMGASWPAFQDLAVSGGYSFSIFRGLGEDNFQQLDRNTHNFNLGVQHQINPAWTVGLSSQGNLMRYLPVDFASTLGPGGQPDFSRGRIQNNSYGWGVGPTVSWRATEFISVNALVNYTEQNYQQDGQVQDTSNFSGITFNLGVNHTINEYLRHSVSGGRSINPGNGSNYTEQIFAGYRLTWQATPLLALHTNLRFTDFDQSGPGFATIPFDPNNPPPDFEYITDDGFVVIPIPNGQKGQQYFFSLGTGFNITDQLSVGITYGLTLKQLDHGMTVNVNGVDEPFGDYLTQSVIVSFAYKF